MEAILDPAHFDVALLDKIVVTANSATEPSALRNQADRVLTAFSEHPESWTRSDSILETSKNPYTHFFALQVLERAVKYRWKSLPAERRAVVKGYLVRKIVTLSSDDATLERSRVTVNKLNQVLVGVLKHEWPAQWPTFIGEIVAASKKSEVLCENNIRILRLLSEEVFDFSKGSLTAAKTEALKASLTGEFEQIFRLCEFILQNSSRASLVNETLRTLQRFVSWIPDRYIFGTGLLPTLCSRFLAHPQFRVATLELLTEVGSLAKPAYSGTFVELYKAVMAQLVRVLPAHVSVPEMYERGTPADQLFVRHLALFMSGFLKAHAALLESPAALGMLMAGLDYLVKISDIDDMDVFKICLDYWQILANELYSQQAQYQPGAGVLGNPAGAAAAAGGDGGGGGSGGGGGAAGAGGGAWAAASGAGGGAAGGGGGGSGLLPGIPGARKALYSELLSRVRQVLIKHMQKPEEVLVEADENGDIVRVQSKDTEALAVYKIMKDTLVYLTHLDPEDTQRVMLEKLVLQMESAAAAKFEYNDLNTLCWAIGSISGAIGEDEEKRFLVRVIKELLTLVEQLKGKNNKAVVASNIMYVVGQYPRFLRAHWKFLRTVVLKLFEFMHERHPGVQDMAVDTFLKIAQKCKRKFVQIQPGEATMFFEEICRMVPAIIADLDTHQVHTFYEACGCMVSAHPEARDRQAMVETLMQLVNNVWKATIARAASNMAVLSEPATTRELARVLRTNVHVCRAVGASFDKQIGIIYMDMLGLYDALSSLIGAAIAANGLAATGSDSVRSARACKREILELVSTFATLPDTDTKLVAAHFMPHFLPPVLKDYASSHPLVRQAEVLSAMTDIIGRLRGDIAELAPNILGAVFEPTLAMITRDAADFPEHRRYFFHLLEAVNTHFPALFHARREHQKLVIDAVVWAFKHTDREVAETGLEILQVLLQNLAAAPPEVSQPFFQAYFLSLVEVLLTVLTDRLHKAHFKMHAAILQQLFALLESGRVVAPLWESAHAVSIGVSAAFMAKVEAAAGPGAAPGGPPRAALMTNQNFMREYARGLIGASFPALKPPQVAAFVEGLFDMTRDLKSYKSLLRDFLIEVLEFRGDDDATTGGLYAEEREQAAAAQAAAEAARRAAVPGLRNPYEAGDEDDL